LPRFAPCCLPVHAADLDACSRALLLHRSLGPQPGAQFASASMFEASNGPLARACLNNYRHDTWPRYHSLDIRCPGHCRILASK
jgi:hypothetical protein